MQLRMLSCDLSAGALVASDDFVETARVMHEAGAALVNVQPRNACYLLGYVAECTLKAATLSALMAPEGLGMSEEEAKRSLRQFVSHEIGRLSSLHRLLALLPSARSGHMRSLDGLTPTMARVVSGGQDAKHEEHWHPNHRYNGARWDDAAARMYLVEAEDLLSLLAERTLDGAQ